MVQTTRTIPSVEEIYHCSGPVGRRVYIWRDVQEEADTTRRLGPGTSTVDLQSGRLACGRYHARMAGSAWL